MRLRLFPPTVCFFFNFLGLGLTNHSKTNWFFNCPTWYCIFWSWISYSFCSLRDFLLHLIPEPCQLFFAAIEYFTDMLSYFVQKAFKYFFEELSANLMLTSNYQFINSDQIFADIDSFSQTQILFNRHRLIFADLSFFKSKTASCSSHTQSTKWPSPFQQKQSQRIHKDNLRKTDLILADTIFSWWEKGAFIVSR